MRIVVSADWQASVANLPRLRTFVDQLVGVLDDSSRRGQSTFLLHLGDVKDAFNPVDQRVTNFLVEAFGRIREASTGFWYVRGNHDSITTQDGVPSCVPLIAALGASAVADEEHVRIAVRLPGWRHGITSYLLLYMVPYFRDPERQRRAFRLAAEDAASPSFKDPTCDAVGVNNVKILAFHNEVAGCRRSLHTTGEGLTAEDMGASCYDLCVGGHIHIPQSLKPNIHFVGSPFPMDWGEANHEHRMLVLDL